MSKRPSGSQSFSQWITDPQTIIALSAVLLSVCGLFIALYEASLIRRQQRAAVWPHVEVSASLRSDRVALHVQNTGVGPARIRAAAVTYSGETEDNWGALVRRLIGAKADSANAYQSLINGRVLPANSAQERVFAVGKEHGPVAPDLMAALQHGIVEGTLDVTVCYCSVYDECWTSGLQDMMSRFRGEVTPGAREVGSCGAMERSGI